jgi:hypothetical protein
MLSVTPLSTNIIYNNITQEVKNNIITKKKKSTQITKKSPSHNKNNIHTI